MTRSHGSSPRNLMLVSLPVSVILFISAYFLLRSLLAACAISGLFLVASSVSNVRFFNEVRRRGRLKGDARAVEVVEVEAFRVFDLEPLGSNSPALCFFADGGEALLLTGQWLLEQRGFPSMSFRLHRWSDTKAPIRVESTGDEIVPEHSTVAVSNYHVSKAELFSAAPETLQGDLDRAFGGRAA